MLAVFFRQHGAGHIEKFTTRPHEGLCLIQSFRLLTDALFKIALRDAPFCVRPPAPCAGARARCVHENAVELVAERVQSGWSVMHLDVSRAGTRNVQVHDRPAGLNAFRDKFDRVLVDAPCTGTGTWRRRPDTKWRITQRNLEERVGQQAEALDQAKAFVRPGGELLYVTCSVLPEENSQQIAAFLKRTPDATLRDTGTPENPGQQNLPGAEEGDGFFYAKLIKE